MRAEILSYELSGNARVELDGLRQEVVHADGEAAFSFALKCVRRQGDDCVN